MIKESFPTYPFEIGENKDTIRGAILKSAEGLILNKIFDETPRQDIFNMLSVHFAHAESLFDREEAERRLGCTSANLFYHDKNHAVFQATYDALSITNTLLAREDTLPQHLSPEGALSIPLAAMYHDAGYVTDPDTENYAARTPIHVEESVNAFFEGLLKHDVAPGLDYMKFLKLVPIGIRATQFPYTPDRTEFNDAISTLTGEGKKEAWIVRLAVQLADLGGQCARPDYFPRGVKLLREELNAYKDTLGDQVIGLDHELAQKARGFIDAFVKPTVGKSAHALLRESQTDFTNSWDKIGEE